VPELARFSEAIVNASKSYKDEFLAKERMAKTYGMPKINSDPELARRFYYSNGKTAAYERMFHGLGQSSLLQRLHTEIKKELE
jgi:hypothetical protein